MIRGLLRSIWERELEMLKVENLESGYRPMQVLWGLNLVVRKGTITALLGTNGAGKSTTLRTIFGSVSPWDGKVFFEDEDVTELPTHKKVEKGIVLVPEGKHLFSGMSVQENLMMGSYTEGAAKHWDESLEMIYTLFPVLKERSRQKAGSLSGGEQQMLAIGRGLMTGPKLMMLDEPSQGLAPKLVREVFSVIERMRKDLGLTVLLVEQNVEISLDLSDYVFIMHEGKIKAAGTPKEIRALTDIREAYLGV